MRRVRDLGKRHQPRLVQATGYHCHGISSSYKAESWTRTEVSLEGDEIAPVTQLTSHAPP